MNCGYYHTDITFYKVGYKHPPEEVGNFLRFVLLQIYFSIRVPKLSK